MFVAVVLLAGLAVAQTEPTIPAPTPPKKPRKVYTEDDLKKMRRGVSVVGTKTDEGSAAAEAEKTETKEGVKPPSVSGDVKTTSEESAPAKPAQQCKSSSWAAVVYAVASEQNVPFDQAYWHQKLFGHRFCTDQVGTPANIAASIKGEYVLDDGRHVFISVPMYKPFPLVEQLVSNNDAGERLVVVWKGRPYYTYELEAYDEVVQSVDGATTRTGRNIVNRFDLYDPGSETHEYFDREKNNLSEIDASFYIRVQIK
jgi:hypothetical protein